MQSLDAALKSAADEDLAWIAYRRLIEGLKPVLPQESAAVIGMQADGEELLQVYPAWSNGRIVANRGTLSFRAFGQSGVTATFAFCDDRGSAAARAVIISQTGRPRVSAASASGSPLSCS